MPLLFAYAVNRFSHDVAQLLFYLLVIQYVSSKIQVLGQRYINITRNAIGPKSGQKDCRNDYLSTFFFIWCN